jgi:hypothetical protein
MGIGPGKRRISVTLDLPNWEVFRTLAEDAGVSLDKAASAVLTDYIERRTGHVHHSS